MTSITQQTRLLADLTTLQERAATLAAGYRMAGERHQAQAADKVAMEARYAADRLAVALATLASAQPMPERTPRIATLADGRPAYTRACS